MCAYNDYSNTIGGSRNRWEPSVRGGSAVCYESISKDMFLCRCSGLSHDQNPCLLTRQVTLLFSGYGLA